MEPAVTQNCVSSVTFISFKTGSTFGEFIDCTMEQFSVFICRGPDGGIKIYNESANLPKLVSDKLIWLCLFVLRITSPILTQELTERCSMLLLLLRMLIISQKLTYMHTITHCPKNKMNEKYRASSNSTFRDHLICNHFSRKV